jgi:hypothetical protein
MRSTSRRSRARIGEPVLRLDELGRLDEDGLARRGAVVQDAGDAAARLGLTASM